jgi:hypothetical protein
VGLDVVRHLLDAHQRSIAPLDTPALILFDRPDRFRTHRMFPRWARLVFDKKGETDQNGGRNLIELSLIMT